jgi:hypothetical protein
MSQFLAPSDNIFQVLVSIALLGLTNVSPQACERNGEIQKQKSKNVCRPSVLNEVQNSQSKIVLSQVYERNPEIKLQNCVMPGF